MSRYDGGGEASFQRAVIEYAQLMQWTVFFTYNSKHSPKGELDLRMFRVPRVVIAELKVGDNGLTPEQRETVELLKQYPAIEVHTWWPVHWPTIEEVLKR